MPALDLRAEQAGDVDTDELREIAVLARALADSPVAAVDHAVRAALHGLDGWEGALQALAAELLAVAPDIPLDEATVERARVLDDALLRARDNLLAAVVAYHHGGAGPAPHRAPGPLWSRRSDPRHPSLPDPMQ